MNVDKARPRRETSPCAFDPPSGGYFANRRASRHAVLGLLQRATAVMTATERFSATVVQSRHQPADKGAIGMTNEVSGFTIDELDAQEATVLPDRELMAKVKAKKLNVAGLIKLNKLVIKL